MRGDRTWWFLPLMEETAPSRGDGGAQLAARSGAAEGCIRLEILRRGSGEILPFGTLVIGMAHHVKQPVPRCHLAALRGFKRRLDPMIARDEERVHRVHRRGERDRIGGFGLDLPPPRSEEQTSE